MSAKMSPAERAQLADLVELAGSPEEVLDVVRELKWTNARQPQLAEVVETIMERKREGVLCASCAEY